MIDPDTATVPGLIFVATLMFKSYVDMENREAASKKRRGGKRFGHIQKEQRMLLAQPIEHIKPVTPEPAKKSQLELDVASALVNFGFQKRAATRFVERA
jgi:hypothetical protein